MSCPAGSRLGRPRSTRCFFKGQGRSPGARGHSPAFGAEERGFCLLKGIAETGPKCPGAAGDGSSAHARLRALKEQRGGDLVGFCCWNVLVLSGRPGAYVVERFTLLSRSAGTQVSAKKSVVDPGVARGQELPTRGGGAEKRASVYKRGSPRDHHFSLP
jgi:hypothetical protein